MTQVAILLGALLLSACSPNPDAPDDDPYGMGSSSRRGIAQEGELCGGIAGFLCDEGLTCEMDGDYPDAAGTCIRKSSSSSVMSQASSAMSDAQKAEAYIRANINTLSPEEAVLGGTFYVTEVSPASDDSFIVSYEDGHIALRARARYEVEENRVKILSFEIVER